MKSAATVCLLLEQFSLLTLIRRRPSRVAGRMHPHHRARPRPRRRNLDPGAHPQRLVNQAYALTPAEIALIWQAGTLRVAVPPLATCQRLCQADGAIKVYGNDTKGD